MTAAAQQAIDPEVIRLVERAQAGDAEAFAQLYDRYVDQTFGYILRRVGHRQTAEDLTGDVVLRAYRRLSSFEWQGVDLGALRGRIDGSPFTLPDEGMKLRDGGMPVLSLDGRGSCTKLRVDSVADAFVDGSARPRKLGPFAPLRATIVAMATSKLSQAHLGTNLGQLRAINA